MPHTKFYGSQIGGPNTKPHSYTDSPLILLRYDILSALKFSPYLPYIVWPIKPFGSGSLCELYPSPANLWAIFLHVVLVCMQLPLVLSVPFWLLFPVWSVVTALGVFLLVNKFISYLLNGSQMEFPSNPNYAPQKKEHEHEQWIFLNGVAVGKHWLQSNVDRLALTFGRPVLGVHNKTEGVIFDVLQCLIQRNFTYATNDVRACYSIIKAKLYEPSLSKVVFILHSQGGIEGGLIIDWLLQEVPQDLLSKLEVYTFGNAANHFNNPHLSLLSQASDLKTAQKHKTKGVPTGVHYHEPLSKLHTSPNRSTRRKSHHTSFPPDKTIRYIEHYAHTSDFVAQWGVLYFTSLSLISSPLTPRFMGRVFERQGQGHQMNQHYLDAMFPLKRAVNPKGGIGGSGFVGVDIAASEAEGGFMGSAMDITPNDKPQGEDYGDEREDLESSFLGAHGSDVSSVVDLQQKEEGEAEVLLRDMSPNSTFHILRHGFTSSTPNGNGDAGLANRRGKDVNGEAELVNGEQGRTVNLKVMDLSRLWLYVNGKSPRADETDFKIARMATL